MAKKVLKATIPLGHRKPNGKWLPYSSSWYRNAHHHESNKVKKYYTDELAEPQLKNHSPMVGVIFSLFILYRPNRRRMDLDNYTSVHKKFFNDALTKYKIIDDDDVSHSPFQISVYGGIDKENPRVDIYVSQSIQTIGQIARKNLCLQDQP